MYDEFYALLRLGKWVYIKLQDYDINALAEVSINADGVKIKDGNIIFSDELKIPMTGVKFEKGEITFKMDIAYRVKLLMKGLDTDRLSIFKGNDKVSIEAQNIGTVTIDEKGNIITSDEEKIDVSKCVIDFEQDNVYMECPADFI